MGNIVVGILLAPMGESAHEQKLIPGQEGLGDRRPGPQHPLPLRHAIGRKRPLEVAHGLGDEPSLFLRRHPAAHTAIEDRGAQAGIGRRRGQDPPGERLGTAELELAIEQIERLRGDRRRSPVAVGDGAVGAVEQPEGVVEMVADHRQIDAPPR